VRELDEAISDPQVTRKTLISLAGPDDGQPAARGLAGLLKDLEESWPGLSVERPYGPLPLEQQNPASERQGSDVLPLVPPTGFEPVSPP
jgi:hypothetical protein